MCLREKEREKPLLLIIHFGNFFPFLTNHSIFIHLLNSLSLFLFFFSLYNICVLFLFLLGWLVTKTPLLLILYIHLFIVFRFFLNKKKYFKHTQTHTHPHIYYTILSHEQVFALLIYDWCSIHIFLFCFLSFHF